MRLPGLRRRSASPPTSAHHASITTPWLRELTEAAAGAGVPFLFGGHALVSDGLRLIVAAAWQGR